MSTEAEVRQRFKAMQAALNERSQRLFAASEALAIGHGGIVLVARATGLAPSTIGIGIKELRRMETELLREPMVAWYRAHLICEELDKLEKVESLGGRAAFGPALSMVVGTWILPRPIDLQRIRSPGAGRKRATEKDPTLESALERLVEPVTRGDPESPLRWLSKSLRHLSVELAKQGHRASPNTVRSLLKKLGYNLQANRKTREGTSHQDRDAQFIHINATVQAALAQGNPVISVDTKKKGLVGEFKKAGREWRPEGDPEKVRVHDFKDKELGRVSPYGIYDFANNRGWVSVGISSDTATFAVATIRKWWNQMGSQLYPTATELVVTADCGGSNGNRVRLWKAELQRLANELGFPIRLAHLPPGTSKWNKIEHRLFSFISQNWRGKPLVSHQVIVSLIAATCTTKGLTVHCEIDENTYPKGQKVSKAEYAKINIQHHEFHGEWNYTVSPNS